MHSSIRLVPIVACALLLPALSTAHEPSENAAPDSIRTISPGARPAVAVADEFLAALRVGDLKHVERLLADDVLILESGTAERSRAEYLGAHAIEDATFLKGARIEVKSRTAKADGVLAWVATETEMHVVSNGHPLKLRSTETIVLRYTRDRWLIVHIHWSSDAPRPE